MEPEQLPEPARVTWLVGPPGAGKSTFAVQQTVFTRVLELSDMMAPLVAPLRLRQGVLEANDRLVVLIRGIERQPSHRGLAPLLVVAGMVTEALFPLADDEQVWLLRPPREQWLVQLRQRPSDAGALDPYADVEYGQRWYDRFDSWIGRPGVQVIEQRFATEKVGGLPLTAWQRWIAASVPPDFEA